MACETRVRPDSGTIKEYTASDQPFRWRCVLPLNSRWHNKHSWNLWRGKRLVTRTKVHAQQNRFVITYIVELSKPYRMVLESWESVQAKQIVPLFMGVYFFRVYETHAAKQLPQNSWTSPGYKSKTTGQQKSSSFC